MEKIDDVCKDMNYIWIFFQFILYRSRSNEGKSRLMNGIFRYHSSSSHKFFGTCKIKLNTRCDSHHVSFFSFILLIQISCSSIKLAPMNKLHHCLNVYAILTEKYMMKKEKLFHNEILWMEEKWMLKTFFISNAK